MGPPPSALPLSVRLARFPRTCEQRKRWSALQPHRRRPAEPQRRATARVGRCATRSSPRCADTGGRSDGTVWSVYYGPSASPPFRTTPIIPPGAAVVKSGPDPSLYLLRPFLG